MRALLFLAASLSVNAYADPSFDATLTPVPTAVSGKLQPFVLAVDGKSVRKETVNATTLWINGAQVTAKKEKGSPFFQRTEGDRLQVRAKMKDGSSRSWDFSMPSAMLGEVQENEVEFLITGKIESMTVDGAVVKLGKNSARWKAPASRKTWTKTRVVELILGKGKPGRLYNMRLVPRAVVDKTEKVEREVAAATTLEIERDVLPLDFRVSQISVFQQGGGNTFSVFPTWNPTYFFTPSISLGAALGGSFFKSATTGSGFLMLSGELLAGYRMESFAVEVGGGVQNWASHGGVKPVASATFSYLFAQPLFGLANRLLAGFTRYFLAENPATEVRVGVGVSF